MPHSIIQGDACFAYFNKIWGIPEAIEAVGIGGGCLSTPCHTGFADPWGATNNGDWHPLCKGGKPWTIPNTTTGTVEADEDILTYTVSDEAIEAAAGIGGGVFINTAPLSGIVYLACVYC